MIQNENSITIQGWMVNKLRLYGNELLIYAVIYSFSQDGESLFYGSRQYLAEWTGASIRTVQNCLNSLVEQGLIEPITKDFGSTVKYIAHINPIDNSAKIAQVDNSAKIARGCADFAQGCADFALNNKDNNKINIKDNTILKNSTAEPSLDNSETKDIKPKRRVLLNDDFSSKGYDTAKEEKKQTKRLNMYDKCILEIDNYTDDDKLKEALKSYLSIRLKMTDKKLLGVNQFKGLLKTLSDLNGDKVAIVERATERGWASFYELKDYQYSNRNNYRKTDCSVFGETPQMRSVSPEEVEGGESSGIIF